MAANKFEPISTKNDIKMDTSRQLDRHEETIKSLRDRINRLEQFIEKYLGAIK